MKKSGRENLWIVIPAYNEEKNIETVIRQWHAIVDKTGEDSGCCWWMTAARIIR